MVARISNEEVAAAVGNHAGRPTEASKAACIVVGTNHCRIPGQGRHNPTRRDLANGVGHRVGDIQVVVGIARDARWPVEHGPCPCAVR